MRSRSTSKWRRTSRPRRRQLRTRRRRQQSAQGRKRALAMASNKTSDTTRSSRVGTLNGRAGAEPRHEAGAERRRRAEAQGGRAVWYKWGSYLSDRQWATVREDYSPYGSSWDAFPHDHARSRAYRWGEDGLLGVSDDTGSLCFALALWNGADPILKERLFGLT